MFPSSQDQVPPSKTSRFGFRGKGKSLPYFNRRQVFKLLHLDVAGVNDETPDCTQRSEEIHRSVSDSGLQPAGIG